MCWNYYNQSSYSLACVTYKRALFEIHVTSICLIERVSSSLQVWKYDPMNFEKVLGPRKFMNNPPAFDSPVLEPNILLQDIARVSVEDAPPKKNKKWTCGPFCTITCFNLLGLHGIENGVNTTFNRISVFSGEYLLCGASWTCGGCTIGISIWFYVAVLASGQTYR